MTAHKKEIEGLNIKRLFLIGFGSIAFLKLIFAFRLDLYSDEIFYWQASTHPALAYSDLPFVTALLAGLGPNILGSSAFSVRLFFLVLGSLIPALVFWLAKPLVARQQAWEACLLSLCLPLSAFLGLLAVPDVALIFFGLLFIGSLERATRLSSVPYWLLVGVAAALGVSTHYRFALYLLAGFAYLLLFSDQRRHWRSPGLWAGAAILALGLYPTLAFNLSNQLGGLDYHLLERHPWEFQAEGLLHPFKQALLVTPLLYLALVYTLVLQLKAACKGDSRRGLIVVFAALNLGVYLVLAPWTDSTRTSIHWPLSGYLPLLVYLPETLRIIETKLQASLSKQRARKLIMAGIALGFTGSLVALLGIGSQSMQNALQPLVGQDTLSTKMVGWKQLNDKVEALLSSNAIPVDSLVVTDNYYTGAQIELGLGLRDVYNIDRDKAIRDGRAIQYALWHKNANALALQTGNNALLIIEDSTITTTDKIATLRFACNIFAEIDFIETLSLFGGAKKFSFYSAQKIGAERPESRCPLPSLPWIDQPVEGAQIADALTVSGWIINEGLGIDTVDLLIDGEFKGQARYGTLRPDVVEAMSIQDDINAPNVGFRIEIEKNDLPKGNVTISLRSRGLSGETQTFGNRTIYVH